MRATASLLAVGLASLLGVLWLGTPASLRADDTRARLAALDPTYPAAYARGVSNLRRGEIRRAADDLTLWVRDHPDGPLTLRARAYLRAAVAASSVD